MLDYKEISVWHFIDLSRTRGRDTYWMRRAVRWAAYIQRMLTPGGMSNVRTIMSLPYLAKWNGLVLLHEKLVFLHGRVYKFKPIQYWNRTIETPTKHVREIFRTFNWGHAVYTHVWPNGDLYIAFPMDPSIVPWPLDYSPSPNSLLADWKRKIQHRRLGVTMSFVSSASDWIQERQQRRAWRKASPMMLALCMSQHPRLGGTSYAANLDSPLIRMICVMFFDA